MATLAPVRHVYKVIHPEKFKEVRHYVIDNPEENRILPEMLNVSIDRKFSKAKNISYWLKGKNAADKKWSESITGLKKTSTSFIYFGDIPKPFKGRFIPKHLLLFQFSKDAHSLTIDVHRNFYTENRKMLSILIQTSFNLTPKSNKCSAIE